MFNLSTFIKNGFLSAVGKMADYQIILNAAGWYEKGVLTEADLAEIQMAIEEKNVRIAEEEAARLEAERLAAEEAARLEVEEENTGETETEVDGAETIESGSEVEESATQETL